MGSTRVQWSENTGTGTRVPASNENIAYDIRVPQRPNTTLWHLPTIAKFKDEPNSRQGAVYKMKCSNCQAFDKGETGRNLNIRLVEHKQELVIQKITLLNIAA